jgi:cell division septation protein DedD
MKDKNNRKSGDLTSESNSQELFEEIFKQATMEIRIEKEGKGKGQKYTPAVAPGRWQQQETAKAAHKSVLKLSEPAGRKSDKVKDSRPRKDVGTQPASRPTGRLDKATPPPRSMPKTDTRKVNKSIASKSALLVLLLAMLAGIVLSYLGIVDTPFLQDYLKLGREQVTTQAPVPRKQAAIPPARAMASSKQPQEKEQSPLKTADEPKAPSLAPSQPSLSSGVKENKIAEVEKPSTVAQAIPGMEGVEGKQQSVTTNDRPNVPEIAAKQESQPNSVQTELSSKPNVPEPATPKPSALKYPYSVYLGSFKSADAVKKAMSEYQGKGLSPYWAKVDLGDKGVWFRFFTGYFQTKEEAEKFIRGHNIQGATPGITRYANLIGIYSSDNEVEDTRKLIESAGFYPYVIKGPSGNNYLYSGAFDRKEYAEKERIILAAKGITSITTER